ncbi:NADH pyrophosphatase, partial [Cryomyces antarcticus]
MTKQPDLPEPAHADLDSMLSRKFGKEVANYFSGSPLNRVGFLRTDNVFLSAALKHPSTSFLLCNDLQPLVKKKASLAYISYKDVEPLIGDPYSKNEDELVAEFNSTTAIPQMIFLGLDERVKDALVYKDHYKGAPFFALDVTPKGSLKEAAEKLISNLESRGLSWAHGRAMDYPASEGTHPLSSYISPASFHRQDRINKSNAYYPSSRIAAIYAEARQLLDWNARNPFCAQCGQPTLSTNAGFKRTCPPKDMARAAGTIGSTSAAQPDTSRPDCATRKGISNLSFPRTDPTVIMAVVSADNKKLLLGRQKRWPPYWYSTLAGFCEPAESVEEAVRREVWEEAGVLLGRVV